MDNPSLQPFVYTGSSRVLDLFAGHNNNYDKGDIGKVLAALCHRLVNFLREP